MTLLIVTLTLLLDAVYGAAHPAITPPAQLIDRQNLRIGLVWSPSVSGTDIVYESFSFSGQTVTSIASFWGWCSAGQTVCRIGTSCASGTLYYPSTTQICPATANRCGTEYLFSSIGAQSGLTRPACYGTSDVTLSNTFFIVSPTAGAAITTSSPQPGITTSTPALITSSSSSTSSSPATSSQAPSKLSSSPPIGAIVGGVVGGIAVIAIAATAIFFLFLRRRKQAGAAALPADVGEHNFPKPQPPPPTTTYDNKHASVVSQYPQSPGSPPPMYQNQAGQNWNTYAYEMPKGVQVSAAPANAPPAHQPGGVGFKGASPEIQAHYGSQNAAAFEMPGSSGHAEPRAGPVEIGGRN